MTTTLARPAIAQTLDDLHHEARSDLRRALPLLPRVLMSRLRGKPLMKALTPSLMRGMYIPVGRADGRLLYTFARGLRATRIVEFGTSFGISTLYLAAAAQDNGGHVFSTEIEPSKCRAAEANLKRAGLHDSATVLEGDALQTLKAVEGPIDMVFLDGWKDLYVPVLHLLLDKLRPGALVLADNINLADTRPYLDYIRSHPDFVSTPLPGNKMEYSAKVSSTSDGVRPKSSSE
jgi:predicted O-methyltransferase YrrM